MKLEFPYVILPFNFKSLVDKFLITNDSGEYYFLDLQDFDKLLSYQLSPQGTVLQDLESRHFVANLKDLEIAINFSATKLRSRKEYLCNFTQLHMMVITLRCNHSCTYCQVSSEEEGAVRYDMPPETAKAIVDTILKSPSSNLKIEFQGGEPLLNWKAIVHTIEYAEALNANKARNIEFVVCTNLTTLDKEKLDFLKQHDVAVSTSLDGPKHIHDLNRKMRNGKSSYERFCHNLSSSREVGIKKLSPLMTAAIESLDNFPEIVDEYIRLGFDGIFFRAINPYGCAAEQKNINSNYQIEKFLQSFEKGLNHIIKRNLEGTFFVEHYTTLLLSRIFTSFSTGFVDLQSPSGAGISAAIYDYNGDVYPADEARMLARMGDKRFLMGNVFKDDYQKIFNDGIIHELVRKSCVECLPACSSCVYNCYCGGDPVRNYLETGDIVGHRPSSIFCKKHIGLFDLLFKKIFNNDENEMDVFWSWITNRSLKEIRFENDKSKVQ